MEKSLERFYFFETSKFEFFISLLVKSYYPKILDAEMEGLKQLTGKNLIQALLGPSAPIPLKTSSTEIAMLPIPFWLWGLDGA